MLINVQAPECVRARVCVCDGDSWPSAMALHVITAHM